jgi:phytoene dehydrogenase-like protein
VRSTFDVVVAGAGHNSLVAAAYLARAGLSCLVLEARADIGGDTSSEELTLPGYLHDTCSTAHNLIQSSIAAEFEDPRCRAFMLWMSFMTMQPPERPGTGLLAYSLAYGRQQHSWTLPRGGSAALPRALAKVIENHGGVIVTGTRVSALVLDGGRCAGVQTESGERYLAARAVLSSMHIKHLIDMAPAHMWGADFSYSVATWQPGISMFVSHYATTRAPAYPTDAGDISPVASGTPQSAERMLRLAADFRAGQIATDDPVLLVLCPTVADPSRAPAGRHTLKVVGFQPYELRGGPERWDELKAGVSADNLAELRRYVPGLTAEVILGSAIKSPLDLERMNEHNWHGSCHGGDASPAQSDELRPAAGWASHRMPIGGLYQTGATTYPGGSVSGAPGRNAAAVLLRDLGSSLAAAIAPSGG